MEEGERGLMADTDTNPRWREGEGEVGGDDGAHVDRDPYSELPSANDEPSSEEDQERVENLGVRREFMEEADILNWPAGEGWRPLKS